MLSLNLYNPILATDSYKLSHQFAYPKDVVGMFSYIEARAKDDVMVPFGLQMFIKKFLTIQVQPYHIDEAEAFAKAHGEPFSRRPWEYMIEQHNGFWPIKIRALPEGTPVRSGHAMVTIECVDPVLFWTVSYIETALLRALWYPTTIASADFKVKRELKRLYKVTGADDAGIPFALHDFGGRGVTCSEQAEIGGAAHMVNFMGSDTIEGVRAANFYYKSDMAGFSVPATEHSIECAFGLDEQGAVDYINHVLDTYAKPGAIVSLVIDGRDVYREAALLCSSPIKEKIIASGAKVVFRPDSGDMMEVVPRILNMQAEAYGYDINEAGYKKIRYVGLLQGDGVDRLSIISLLMKLATMNYAADNMVFGSGGGLLQKVDRDTYKFAQKASAILVKQGDDTKWIGISKDPITDPGKKSKEGRLGLARSLLTGEFITYNLDLVLSDEFVDQLITVYENGVLLKETTLDEVRARTQLW